MGDKKPLWAKCSACGTCWEAVQLPMELELAAIAMMAVNCPNGCDAPPVIAKQDNGVLLEAKGE